jgi:uncharacterized membrane protein YdjX (TVP38/TMEM64 family)
MSNYFYGLTKFLLREFVGGTIVEVIPLSVLNVYLGSITSDITTLGMRHENRMPWSLYIAGFIATLSIVLYLNRLAHQALKRYTEREKSGDNP